MKGYKAFEKGLVCRGKQYAENTVFEEESAEICNKGMHFCENPFDVLNYYPLVNSDGEFSEFAEVEALGDVVTDGNKKFCTAKLRVGAKLSFADFVKACVDFVAEKATFKDSSGYAARIGSSGENSVICCAGYGAKVKARVGSWITLSEWAFNEEENCNIPVCVKTEYVDGERIKADTWYRPENGEFREVEA